MGDVRLQMRWIQPLQMLQYRFAAPNGWAPRRWRKTVYLAWVEWRRALRSA